MLMASLRMLIMLHKLFSRTTVPCELRSKLASKPSCQHEVIYLPTKNSIAAWSRAQDIPERLDASALDEITYETMQTRFA